jgi:hypothetical protein
VINAGQTAFGFRPQEAVRVGDYADPEGHRWKRLAECMRVYSPRRVSSRRMGIASTRADRSSSDRVAVLADQKNLKTVAVRGEPGSDLTGTLACRQALRSERSTVRTCPWRKTHRCAVALWQRHSGRGARWGIPVLSNAGDTESSIRTSGPAWPPLLSERPRAGANSICNDTWLIS